ncbi:hypothetical protein AAC387_Pa04g1760 [Persea americana]
MQTESSIAPVHVALFPSAGMGHLAPFLRLAVALNARGCTVTFVSIRPTVSSAEAFHLLHFFSTYPQIHCMEFHLLPHEPSTASPADPFFLQWESIRHSAHLLPSLLTSTSPPISALITDIILTSSIFDAVANLPFSNYVLFTSCAAMLALFAYFPIAAQSDSFDATYQLQIPGLQPIPNSDIPPPLLLPKNFFKTTAMENGLALMEADGIIVNTFDALEPNTLMALNKGIVVPAFPPVVTVGPLEPCSFEHSREGTQQQLFSWLNAQPARSVVYVSFGSRNALSRDQIKQLAEGLEKSNCRFLWAVKSKIVDKEDSVALGELVGDEFLERVKEKGFVVNGWVEQWGVLGHPAVGGFMSHCGWNSVAEAAWHGVPVLAWPQAGDQRINAGVVERSGLGIWERKWGWGGDKAEVVMGAEIGEKLQEFMKNAGIRVSAARVREEAKRAISAGGTSTSSWMNLIERLKSKVI